MSVNISNKLFIYGRAEVQKPGYDGLEIEERSASWQLMYSTQTKIRWKLSYWGIKVDKSFVKHFLSLFH